MASTRTDTAFLEAEGAYFKAAKAELERDLDRAFNLYIKAAEGFLHLSQTTGDSKLRAASQSEAGKALERAEKLKAVRKDLAPVARDLFSEPEQLAVLRKSALVNKIRYPFWDDDPSIFSDDISQPQLSAEQKNNAASWRRMPAPDYQVRLASLSLLPEEIIQHIVADCSVCASISICVNHNQRFDSNVGYSCLFPQGQDNAPANALTGKYSLRVLFNGAYRRVSIDDQLPTYPDGMLMCMSTGPRHQLWPSLVEKAYMKLMGGYEFPGSNSSVDLHVLAGWIPDHIDMKRPGFQREKTWNRIKDGFVKGACILTIGTGKSVVIPPWSSVALLPAHCYAIVDIQDVNGDRRMTILDPWVKVPSLSESGEHPLADDSTSQQGTGQSRMFSLSWDAICDLFDGVYLSWDPGIFQHQMTFHGSWQSKHPIGGEHSAHFRLRVHAVGDLELKDGHDVWILLTRHVTDTRRKGEYVSLLVRDGSEPADNLDAVALKGEYTDSVHVLVRTQLRSIKSVLGIVASYDGNLDDVGFTVTVYSNISLAWSPPPPKAMYSKHIDVMFTSKTAGGNHTCPSFFMNPQYYLRIHPMSQPSGSGNGTSKASAAMVVKGSRKMPLNVTAVWSQGERITEMGHNDVALSSGPYSYGYARATSTVLPVGDYTVIVSTFDPQHLGPFSLSVESDRRFDLEPIPLEGAGMYSKVVRGEWTVESAGGSVGSNEYRSNPAYEIQVATQTQLKMRLQLVEPSPTISINVTLFRSMSQPSARAVTATSGPYSDAVAGVITPQVTLVPGTYVAVPSTYSPRIQRAFKLIIYSTSAVKVALASG